MTIIMRIMLIVIGMMTIIFEDDDDNCEDDDDSYEDDIDSYGDDDDVAAYSYLGLVVGSPWKILPASLLRSWKVAGMRQRDRRPPPNTE